MRDVVIASACRTAVGTFGGSSRALRYKTLGPHLGGRMGRLSPSVMGLSPVPEVKHLLATSSLSVPDFHLIEVNEAFAAQYIGCEREVGLNREITIKAASGIE